MSEDKLEEQVRRNTERIDDLEDISEITDRLIERFSELKGRVDLLGDQLTAHLLNLERAVKNGTASTDKLASWRTAFAFAAAVIVPILVAVVGGYFALKASGAGKK